MPIMLPVWQKTSPPLKFPPQGGNFLHKISPPSGKFPPHLKIVNGMRNRLNRITLEKLENLDLNGMKIEVKINM